MGWMLSQQETQWQVIDDGEGRLLATLTWRQDRRAWGCDCQCLHQRFLELAGVVGPPPGSRGQIAPGTTFDPFTQKGY